MQYRELFGKSLMFSWKHKLLWVFALFAALAGNGGEIELLFSGSDSLNGQATVLGYLQAFHQDGTLNTMITNFSTYLTDHPLPAIFIVLLFLALFLMVLWLIVVMQAALVWAIARLQTKPVRFSEAFGVGMKYFSPIFIMNLIVKVVLFGILGLIAVPMGIAYVRTGGAIWNSLYALVVFLVLVPLNILFAFLLKYASAYVVLRGQRWTQAFANGWRLFLSNWLVSLETAVFLFLINLVSSLVLVFALALLGLLSNAASTLVFFTIITVFGIYIATFQYSTWVFLFLELEKGTVRSKLLRATDQWTRQPKSVIGK